MLKKRNLYKRLPNTDSCKIEKIINRNEKNFRFMYHLLTPNLIKHEK